MPLSEHEERILAEIERQLAAEDPRFAARSRRAPSLPSLTRQQRVRAAVVLALLGIVTLAMLGILAAPWNLVSGAFGLLCLLLAILLGATSLSSTDTPAQQHVPPDERL